MNKKEHRDYTYMHPRKFISSRGFTLIEILVVIGIIAILATITISSINPSKQFKQARDTERMAHVAAILDGLHQNMVDNGGTIDCDGASMSVPQSTSTIASAGGVDIGKCLIPDYLPSMPFDPSMSTAYFNSVTDYSTGYKLKADLSGRMTISATAEAKTGEIAVTR